MGSATLGAHKGRYYILEALNMRHTLFISDIHLERERADITECFLNILATEAPKADALYILGDLFEVFN